jgi:hypothetical protein
MDNPFLRDFIAHQARLKTAGRTPSGPTAQQLKAEKKNMDVRIRPEKEGIFELVERKASNKEVLEYFRERIEELGEDDD